MSAPDVAARILRIVADNLGETEHGAATVSTSLRDELEADSLDLVELEMTIEEEFGIEVLADEQDLAPWKTVADVIAYVEKRTAGR